MKTEVQKNNTLVNSDSRTGGEKDLKK